DHHGGDHDGDHHGGGHMGGGCSGMHDSGPPACNPSAPVVEACNKSLDACLSGANVAADCIAKAESCAGSAIQDHFKAMCDANAANCDGSAVDAVACNQIKSACTDG